MKLEQKIQAISYVINLKIIVQDDIEIFVGKLATTAALERENELSQQKNEIKTYFENFKEKITEKI